MTLLPITLIILIIPIIPIIPIVSITPIIPITLKIPARKIAPPKYPIIGKFSLTLPPNCGLAIPMAPISPA